MKIGQYLAKIWARV